MATRNLKPIILYDIPRNSPECKPWSPNTWKVRYALNYKCIPFETEWVEFPDFAALYQSLNLAITAQTADGSPHYTLPVIQDPNTNASIADSMSIVKYLDRAYPRTPTLVPKGTYAFHEVFVETIKSLFESLYHVVGYAVWTRLNERNQVWYRTRCEAHFGRKLEELGTGADWEKAEHACEVADKWLRANLEEGEGRDELVMGDAICFADIVLASGLMWARAALGRESEEWARIMSWNAGKWKKITERLAKYEGFDS